MSQGQKAWYAVYNAAAAVPATHRRNLLVNVNLPANLMQDIVASHAIVSQIEPTISPSPVLVPELEDDRWKVGSFQVWWAKPDGTFLYVDPEGVVYVIEQIVAEQAVPA